jgi:hypothetical protein
MRIAITLLLFATMTLARAQYNPRFHSAIGFTEASLNFKQNFAGSLTFPVRYDLLRFNNSSLSLGTRLKIGFCITITPFIINVLPPPATIL